MQGTRETRKLLLSPRSQATSAQQPTHGNAPNSALLQCSARLQQGSADTAAASTPITEPERELEQGSEETGAALTPTTGPEHDMEHSSDNTAAVSAPEHDLGHGDQSKAAASLPTAEQEQGITHPTAVHAKRCRSGSIFVSIAAYRDLCSVPDST